MWWRVGGAPSSSSTRTFTSVIPGSPCDHGVEGTSVFAGFPLVEVGATPYAISGP